MDLWIASFCVVLGIIGMLLVLYCFMLRNTKSKEDMFPVILPGTCAFGIISILAVLMIGFWIQEVDSKGNQWVLLWIIVVLVIILTVITAVVLIHDCVTDGWSVEDKDQCLGCFFVSIVTFGVLYIMVVLLVIAFLWESKICSSAQHQIDYAPNNTTFEKGCISREDCPVYTVCSNMTFKIGFSMDDYGDPARLRASGSGFCRACSTFPFSECYPPCHYDGNVCTADLFAFDMNLDQKLPYYGNAISAVTTPSISLLVFTPTTMQSPKGNCWKWFKSNTIRGIFLAMAFNTLLVDIGYQWKILQDTRMCLWMKLWALATTVSTSSNLAAAAAMLSMFMSRIITDNPFGITRLAEKYGILFVIYYIFLAVLYTPAIFVLLVLSIPGMLAYCWLVIIYIILALLIGKYVSRTVTIYLRKSFAAAKASILDEIGDEKITKEVQKVATTSKQPFLLKEAQEEAKTSQSSCWQDPFLEELEEKTIKEAQEEAQASKRSCTAFLFRASPYNVYFWIPLGLPLISFLIPLSARLFNGYGYRRALWVTLNERHATTFFNHIRRRLTTTIDFSWNIL